MNPYAAYQQQAPVAITRIDLLLALYDGAIDRIGKALAALAKGDRTAALPLIARTQLIVTELAAGVRMDVDPSMGSNALRLYEFAVHQLARADSEGLTSALNVLTTLRVGFETIRKEAAEMERTGQIPNADSIQTFSSLA
jgi:flagellar protein FliS